MEFAFIGTTGNASTQTIGLGGEVIVRPRQWVVRTRGAFNRNKSEDALTAESIQYLLRSDRELGTRASVFAEYTFFRAYLARMYRRYGDWQDAIAAYNWGPGNLDTWIGGGRAADKLPLAVERYRSRVLREAVLAEPGIIAASRWGLGGAAPRGPEARGPEDRPAVPPPAAVAFVADALQRGSAAGKAALREFAAALLNRAADWKSAYAGFAGRIVALAKKRSTAAPDLEADYAARFEPVD